MAIRPIPPNESPGSSLPAALAAVVLWAAITSGPAAEPGSNPAAQARRLQADFKRAGSGDERKAVATALLDLGVDGGRRLHAIARTEYLQRLQRYSAGFQRAAEELVKDRAANGDVTQEIAGLRQTIRDVAARAELTKEMIEATSDPALSRLEELLVVSADEVLKAHPELASQRADLVQLADWAARAADLLPEKDRDKLPPLPTGAAAAEALAAADELAALLAGPIPPSDRHVLAANAVIARELDPEEARGIQRLNQIRILVGLPAQAVDAALVRACRVHSEDMCTKGFFAHESPVPGRESPWKRAQAAGTSAGAENIAAGTESGPGAIRMWWHSPGHHKNMLGDHKRTGLGRYERHWTQLFG